MVNKLKAGAKAAARDQSLSGERGEAEAQRPQDRAAEDRQSP